MEDDFERVSGFGEPMIGSHGNRCFVALSKWEDICSIPVLKLLDTLLMGHTTVPVPEEHSLFATVAKRPTHHV
jgi:hypothetical protein